MFLYKVLEISELYDSEKELIVDVNLMLKRKITEIFDQCHRKERLIIWKDLLDYLMHEPLWLTEFRAKWLIAWARRTTSHKEFWNKERL